MAENIEYRCIAKCEFNNGTGRAYCPCRLKNKGLKPNKDTVRCYGGPCGFLKEAKNDRC